MAWKKITEQKHNQNYKGRAELCEWEFTVPLPEQVGAEWLANRTVQGFIDELNEQNSYLLELHMWEDTSSTMKTRYYVSVIASASPLFWKVAILGVLAFLAIAGVAYVINKIEDILTYIGDEVLPDLPEGAIKWGSIAVIAVATTIGLYLVRR